MIELKINEEIRDQERDLQTLNSILERIKRDCKATHHSYKEHLDYEDVKENIKKVQNNISKLNKMKEVYTSIEDVKLYY